MKYLILPASPPVAGVSAFAASALFAASTFFWEDGEYNKLSAILMMYSMIPWMIVFTGTFGWIREHSQRLASWGWYVAIYGCVGGINLKVNERMKE